ncbi:MAG: glycosyltransferase family 9 protein [Nitrospinaceae bacterium]
MFTTFIRIELKLFQFFKNIFQKPEPPSEPRSIFVGLIGGVGDLVLAAPSIAALKKKYPQASLCFGVGDAIFYATIKNDPHIDRFDTPFFYNVWKKWSRGAVERKKSREFDRVILLDNPDKDWWKEKKHLIDIYAEKCGVTLDSRRPIMYINEDDKAEGDRLLRQAGFEYGDRLVVVSPEVRSKKEKKEWPHNQFAELIRRLKESKGVKIISFVSPKGPADFPGAVTFRDPPIRAAAEVVRRAELFIGLDNGLTHIAAAFDVEILSVHIGFPIECCGVLSPHATLIAHEPFCNPDSISVDEVYVKAKTVLEKHA